MEWIITLWMLGGFAPVAFVTMKCCVVAAGCTGACGDGGAPANLQVVITGVVDNRCVNCDLLNATYTVPKVADLVNGCRWIFDFECGNGASPVFDLCTHVNLQDTCTVEVIQYDSTNGPYKLWCRIKDSIIFGGETSWFNSVFEDDKGSRPECTDYTNELPPLVFSYDTGACDGSGVVADISAL